LIRKALRKIKKTLQTARYLFKSFAWVTVSGFLSVLVSVAITDLVYHLTDRSSTPHPVVSLTTPFEVVDVIFALLIGLILFITNLKVSLANGISRKTFLLANLPVAMMAAAALVIFNLIVALIHGLFWPINFISDLFYPHTSLAGLVILQFALYFLLIVAGWFITLAYYRSSVPVKWAISLAPFVLYALLRVANAFSAGVIFTSLGDYLRMSTSGPYTAAISWLAYSAILYGLVYLLIRRAPLKD
jgi:hypothetical protein